MSGEGVVGDVGEGRGWWMSEGVWGEWRGCGG